MELTIRDWMVIIGALLILAVVVDAVRRMRRDRYSRVKVKLLDPSETGPRERDEELTWLKELPNGGARVVEREDLLRQRQAAAASQPAPKKPQRVEPVSEPGYEEDEVPLLRGISSRDEELPPENIDWLDALAAEESGERRGREPMPEPGRLPREVDPEVFMLNVVSRNPSGFRGEDILHILLACDLRFGDMNFFHRHEHEAGRGAIQFSVANMMQPGVFDIDNMADFSTPGLVFFLTLPGPENMMQAFEFMLETAQAVARNLEGDVLDETRSALTRQTLEHSRQKIRDLERRLLAKAR